MFSLDVKEGQQLWAHKHDFKATNGKKGLYYDIYAAGPHILTQKKYDDRIELFMCGIPIKTYHYAGHPHILNAQEDIDRANKWVEVMYGVDCVEWAKQERDFYVDAHKQEHTSDNGRKWYAWENDKGEAADTLNTFHESSLDYKVDKCVLHSKQYIIKDWADNEYKPSDIDLYIQTLVKDGTIETRPWTVLLDKKYHMNKSPQVFHVEQDDGLVSLVPWMIKTGWEPYASQRS